MSAYDLGEYNLKRAESKALSCLEVGTRVAAVDGHGRRRLESGRGPKAERERACSQCWINEMLLPLSVGACVRVR